MPEVAWLLAGSILLALAVFLPGPPSRAAQAAAAFLLLAAFVAAFWVYPVGKVFNAVGAGAVVGFVYTRLAPRRRPLRVRLAALGGGTLLVAFALFGPASGLA